jgi:hypothetical protein
MAHIPACGYYVVYGEQAPGCDCPRLNELRITQPAARLSTPAHTVEQTIGRAPLGADVLPAASHLGATAATRRFLPRLWQLRTPLWEQRGFTSHQPPNEHSESYRVGRFMLVAG